MIKIVVVVIILTIIVGTMILVSQPFNKSNLDESMIPFKVENGKYIGIVYIGGSEENYDYSVVNKYYKNDEFDIIDVGGEEKYLIIPLGNPVSVFSLDLTEDGGVEEKLIRKTMIAPFYIKCNVSDIFSNSLLRVTVHGKQYSYSPYISLKDGSVVVENFVQHVQE